MRIEANHPNLQYCGRIDFSDPKAPVLVYAASFVKLRFSGTSVKVVIRNHRNYFQNSLGYLLDGFQGRIELVSNDKPHTYVIAMELPMGEHELTLFKRQDGCHYVTFLGFELEEGAKVLPVTPLPKRRIEVFGDSVSCGEVCEAIDYVGQSDPENHEGIFSNSYYSYAWIAARLLGAQLHDCSQGGLALLDQTGWFNYPDFVGAKTTFDKIQYNPYLGEMKKWDFNNYIPQVVVVALGQNDSNPEDYMKENYDSEKSQIWREEYQSFVANLMEVYPNAQFVLTTTILEHDASWDRSIDEVAGRLDSSRVHHFLYSKNGSGTSGHIRIPEAEVMGRELAEFINSLNLDW